MFAWAVEILAASIGLLIAVLVIISTQQSVSNMDESGSNSASHIMNAFLGGLPFIVVAAVELTKIPLATACYHADRPVWRFVLGVGFVFLMVITFETILNGFERNFTERTYVIKQLKKRLISTEEAIENLLDDNKTLSEVTHDEILSGFNEEVNQIERNLQSELDDIEKQASEARRTYGGRQAAFLEEQKAELEAQIQDLDNGFDIERTRILQKFDTSDQQLKEAVEEEKAALNNEIELIQRRLAQSREDERQELTDIEDPEDNSAELAQEIHRITADYEQRKESTRSTVHEEDNTLTQRISEVRRDIEGIIEQRNSDIKNEVNLFNRVAKSAEIEERYEIRLDSLQEELGSLRARRGTLSIEQRLTELDASKDREIESARQSFNSRQSSGDRQREEIRRSYRTARELDERRIRELSEKLSTLTVSEEVVQRTGQRVDELEELDAKHGIERERLLAERNGIANELSRMEADSRDELQPILRRLQERRAAVSRKYEEIRQVAQERYENSVQRFEYRGGQVNENQGKVQELSDQRLAIRDEINGRAETSQIYRVAALWTGKDSPADVTNEELRWISLVWFGSLAAITAWTGGLLAFGGLVVRYGGNGNGNERRGPGHWALLGKTIRRSIVHGQRRSRRPRIKYVDREVVRTKEVEKEVPVDRIVFKEVPREVVRKELVYVPFFTDDPDLARKYAEGKGNRSVTGEPDE